MTANTVQVPRIDFGTTIAPTGTLKGVMVFMNGLQSGAMPVFPLPMVDSVFLGLGGRFLTLGNTIAATGWQVLGITMPGYGALPAGQNQLVFDDITSDPGNGTRLVSTIGAWWDYVVWWIQNNISPTVPIVPVGMSFGAFHALHVALSRSSTIAGYVAHHPATILSDLNPTFTIVNYNTLAGGADITASSLNGLHSIPGQLGWGSIDIAVGASPWSTDTLTPVLYSTAHAAGAPVSPNCDGTGTASAGSPPENHVLTDSTDNANPNNDVFQIAAWFHANLPHN